MSSSSSAAAQFSPYQPPPDERPGRTKVTPGAPASVPAQAPAAAAAAAEEDEYYDDPRYATEGYQSGGGGGGNARGYHDFDADHDHGALAASPFHAPIGAGGAGASRSMPGGFSGAQPGYFPSAQPDHASYVTSQGISISNLCFAAWALPPFSGVAVLILETTNDLARFHAYQSALCGVAWVLALYVLRSWFGWYTLSIIVGMGSLGAFWVAGSNASQAAPTLAKIPYIPHIGPLAEEWVGSE